MCSSIEEIPKKKLCTKRVMENLVLYMKYGQLVHKRFVKMKRVSSTVANSFVLLIC